VNLQTTLALLQSPVKIPEDTTDPREPYTHPALEGLPNMTGTSIEHTVGKKRMASLASQMGMVDIIRWVPRMVSASFGQFFGMEILTVLCRGMI
jgi:large subunit ribosomal protein L15